MKVRAGRVSVRDGVPISWREATIVCRTTRRAGSAAEKRRPATKRATGRQNSGVVTILLAGRTTALMGGRPHNAIRRETCLPCAHSRPGRLTMA